MTEIDLMICLNEHCAWLIWNRGKQETLSSDELQSQTVSQLYSNRDFSSNVQAECVLTPPEIDHIMFLSFRNALVRAELSACAICMSESIKCMLGTVSISFLFSLTIHLSTYLYLHSFPSFLQDPSLPLVLSLELLNYLTSDSGLGC